VEDVNFSLSSSPKCVCNVTHDSRRSYSQDCLSKCYMVVEETASHYQVLQNVYVMLHMIAEGHILKIGYVNVTWWKTTTSHYQVLHNVCVTHGSRWS
jgi:hypothetical protein